MDTEHMYFVICPSLPNYIHPYSVKDKLTDIFEPIWPELDFLIYVAM